MEVRREFARVRFSSAVLRKAIETWRHLAPEVRDGDYSGPPIGPNSLTITRGPERWNLEDEDEWFGEVARTGGETSYEMHLIGPQLMLLTVHFDAMTSMGYVKIRGLERGLVQRVLNVFLDEADACTLPPPNTGEADTEPPVTVFIGHGHNADWRRIKDHLQDKHGYSVEAYEVGSRAGHTIRDVLENMLTRSSFALLVMTAEDETGSGEMRARQNVVHEAGLFQGRLGFHRAIAVVEEGVEVFSNLQGVDQIRYASAHVETSFGEILATLRREFGDRR